MRCSGRGIAFPFSAEQLSRLNPNRKLTFSKALSLNDVTADVVLNSAPEPVRSFSAIVSLRLLDGKSDLDGAARMAGMSLQGLQRRLRSSGYTYKEVLEVAQRIRAVTLLTQTSLSVAEIAFALGYDEHANFTRAFNRWTGLSPSAYRFNYGIDSQALILK